MKTITCETEVKVTPKILATAFWNMCSIDQANFFHELALIVLEAAKNNPGLYSYGEMQWCYMANDIKLRSEKAWNMFLAVSSFSFDLWEQKP